MRFMLVSCLVLALLLASPAVSYSLERFVDSGAAELAPSAQAQAQAARAQELEFIKRFLPAKERRAPLEGFEDMSGFLRTIDGIQKPRFG